eukprot:TRINITY_DN15326_c0_g1_i1.p1 TRINITY_DN15326_c0_g1~~TRINITY_DN15326_c0_g1_i1.p1  ORF type:complete len:337 (+),score=36.24 TRINITY_DN15326_c0_g1_i1:33-1043(+)
MTLSSTAPFSTPLPPIFGTRHHCLCLPKPPGNRFRLRTAGSRPLWGLRSPNNWAVIYECLENRQHHYSRRYQLFFGLVTGAVVPAAVANEAALNESIGSVSPKNIELRHGSLGDPPQGEPSAPQMCAPVDPPARRGSNSPLEMQEPELPSDPLGVDSNGTAASASVSRAQPRRVRWAKKTKRNLKKRRDRGSASGVSRDRLKWASKSNGQFRAFKHNQLSDHQPIIGTAGELALRRFVSAVYRCTESVVDAHRLQLGQGYLFYRVHGVSMQKYAAATFGAATTRTSIEYLRTKIRHDPMCLQAFVALCKDLGLALMLTETEQNQLDSLKVRVCAAA